MSVAQDVLIEVGQQPIAQLHRHEQRRRGRIPNVSSLVGPVGLASRVWRKWCTDTQRSVVDFGEPVFDRVVIAWVNHLLHRHDLAADAERYIANQLARPDIAGQLKSKTRHELGLLLAQMSANSPDVARLACWLMERRNQCHQLTFEDLNGCFTSAGNSDEPFALLSALFELLPAGTTPTLLSVQIDECDSTERLDRAVRLAARFVTELPYLAIGIVISPALYERYLREAPESFAKAILRDGVIQVCGCSADEIRGAFAKGERTGVAGSSSMLDNLVAHGASAELVERLVAAATANSEASDKLERFERRLISNSVTDEVMLEQIASKARSAQEQFLYELLEHTPDLAGIFELNVAPGFDFGGAPAELDLASLQLKLAIEVDGYYHFHDAECYRRDRRKDFVLQRHGFFVLRFLASDVVPEMESILRIIRSAVAHRRGSLQSSFSLGQNND